MSLKHICCDCTKGLHTLKLLMRGSTLAQGPLEIGQLQRLLRWVKMKSRGQVERIVDMGVTDLIDLTEPEEEICALHIASAQGDLDMVRLLLSLKAHPDTRDKKGRTAIMFATEHGHADVVELLASHQANTTLMDDEGKGLLFYSIKSKKLELVEMVLNLGADVNIVSFLGESVLMLACKQAKECEDMCMRLLEEGADPNISDPETSRTPLLEAVRAESVALVRMILHSGGDPNAVDNNRLSAAHIAASKGCIEMLRILSAYSADFNLKSVLGDTPLHVAAAADHDECCRFLCQRGSDMVKNMQGLFPIRVAELHSHIGACKELKKAEKSLKAGKLPAIREARLHDWSREHEAVLRQAFQSADGAGCPAEDVSKETFVTVLQEHSAPVDTDYLESLANELSWPEDQVNIKVFFEGRKFLPVGFERSSFKATTPSGRTDSWKPKKDGNPLHICTAPFIREKINDIRQPTKENVSGPSTDTRPGSQDNLWAERKENPFDFFKEPEEVFINIHKCVKTEDFELLKLGLRQGVPVDIRDYYFKTPLMIACMSGNYEMSCFLMSQKADVNAFDHLKWTNLHHACFAGHADIVKLLLEHGAVVDVKTSHGVTPLMRAIQSCRPECVKLLLEAGANVKATDQRGQSSLLLAQKYGTKTIQEMICNTLTPSTGAASKKGTSV